MSEITQDLIKFLHCTYETKLKDLKFNKGDITLLKIYHKLETIEEIRRLLETINLQSSELDVVLNHEI